LKRRIKKREIEIININECYTSKRCYVCEEDLLHVKDFENKDIWRLKYCPTCGKNKFNVTENKDESKRSKNKIEIINK
jgi:Zn finger protein HypA/HybF involved in hydrogenase expression